MPGIVTHNRVFAEAVNLLSKEKQKSTHSKSIEALFKSDPFRRAGLFGAIGPNIFDYIPVFKNNYICGSKISYELHSAQSSKILKSMLEKILSYQDYNNEWASLQKAYLYGFISHMISDAVFHPYVYYWAGFTNSARKKDQLYSREQFLLFEYNMDLFFSQPYEINSAEKTYNFNLNDMLPAGEKVLRRTEHAIKMLLLDSLKETKIDIYNKSSFNNNSDSNKNKLNRSVLIDLIPVFISLSYKIKRSRNPRLLKIMNYIKRKNLFYSDFFINYPYPARINTHILNLHKERWFHPTGAAGLHYESVRDLLTIAAMNTANIWKKIEEIQYNGKKNITDLEKELQINAITGIYDKNFTSMQMQNPVRPRY
jgi:hypothetical protein